MFDITCCLHSFFGAHCACLVQLCCLTRFIYL